MRWDWDDDPPQWFPLILFVIIVLFSAAGFMIGRAVERKECRAVPVQIVVQDTGYVT